jgi:hypothetical protein
MVKDQYLLATEILMSDSGTKIFLMEKEHIRVFLLHINMLDNGKKVKNKDLEKFNSEKAFKNFLTKANFSLT